MEFRVNSYTTDEQRRPAVAADGSGNFVVVWDSYSQNGPSYGVIGQRFNSAGSKVGSEFRINTYTTNHQVFPAVAADGSGEFVVVWSSDGADGALYGVFGQRYDAAGIQVGSEFQVNTTSVDSQSQPALAVDGADNFVVAWSSAGADASSYGLVGQRFDSTAAKVGSEFLINTFETNAQVLASVAMHPSGNFVVAWQSSYQDDWFYGVFGQGFDDEGLEVGSEFQLNAFTTSFQARPATVVDGAGNFFVAWQSDGQDAQGYAVVARKVTIPLFLGDFEAADVCAWSANVGSGDLCIP